METNRLRVRDKLRNEDITALINDDIFALVIRGYVEEESCKFIVGNMLKDSGFFEKYTHELLVDGEIKEEYFGVDRLGVPFNSTYRGDIKAKEIYYTNAKKSIQKLRSYCHGGLSPIDKLRLELDENYIHGASVARFEKQNMLAGIARYTTHSQSHSGALQPHFDALPEKFESFESQFAANIYLQVPNQGGELEIWDVEALKPLSTPPNDWRAMLPESKLIKPRNGDLILFNCRKPHAVSAFAEGSRVSVQTFIGFKENSSLKIWN